MVRLFWMLERAEHWRAVSSEPRREANGVRIWARWLGRYERGVKGLFRLTDWILISRWAPWGRMRESIILLASWFIMVVVVECIFSGLLWSTAMCTWKSFADDDL